LQEAAATEGVDGPQGRECEEEVDESEAERSPQRSIRGEPRVHENCRRVKGNDVDSAHLLTKHDNKRGQSRASDTRDSEELDEATNVVAIADYRPLNFELTVNIVKISCRLNGIVAQSQKGLERLRIFVFFLLRGQLSMQWEF